MQLATAKREGLLQRGDIVVGFALASGMSAAAAVLRWS
jgi:3-oxoacyl-[acyl-carrier-protein] synthase III